MSGNVVDFPAAERRRPHDATHANDTRERADAEWVQALNFSTMLIVGVVCFFAGALTLATLAFALVRFHG